LLHQFLFILSIFERRIQNNSSYLIFKQGEQRKISFRISFPQNTFSKTLIYREKYFGKKVVELFFSFRTEKNP